MFVGVRRQPHRQLTQGRYPASCKCRLGIDLRFLVLDRFVGDVLAAAFDHSAGGRPGERLMRRLGRPVSDDTILRQLKRDAAVAHCASESRVVGIDDWS